MSWHHALSIFVLATCILLAVGTTGHRIADFFPDIVREDRGGGRVEETVSWSKVDPDTGDDIPTYYTEYVGYQNDDEKFIGEVTVKLFSPGSGGGDPVCRYTEVVNMTNGLRDGDSEMTFRDGRVEKRYYYMGKVIEQYKGSYDISEISAYQVFRNDYPWYHFMLHAIGFHETYLETFLDTLEIILNQNSIVENEFGDRYSEVVEILEETPHDSIISMNSFISSHFGLNELKDSEFRMAVIDCFRQEEVGTYQMILNTYPGYLDLMHMGDATDPEFEEFCRVFDSCMVCYGVLDKEDFHFIDSLNQRIYRAVMEIYESGDSDSKGVKSALDSGGRIENQSISRLYKSVRSVLFNNKAGLTTSEVSEVVLYFMFMRYDQGDLFKKAVKKAWCIQHNVLRLPVLTTKLLEQITASSAKFECYIIEDGGAQVSSSGLVWAQTYNPTIEDNIESSGTGMGEFNVTLEGLIEGEAYYARAYAINSADTAYGNCIKFVATAEGPSAIWDEELSDKMKIWPNPASETANLGFWIDSRESASVIVVGMNGQVVFQKELGVLPAGQNIIEIDLTGIQEGSYQCLLKCGNRAVNSRKIVIVK